ncbi:MAG: PIG-L family deacetylase [Actinomycetota bacterium]|nr:PIG-L family deacetylase [Actinomycetota bacterium]
MRTRTGGGDEHGAIDPSGRPVELSGVRRALGVVAHPDDESFGLGAVLSSLVDWGIAVDLVCFSRGEASTVGARADLGRTRARELAEAAAVLGLGEAWGASFPDGSLQEHRDELAACLAEKLAGVDALVVLEASGVTGHPDHRAATEVAQRTADRLGLVCIEWGVSVAVAAALADEMGAPLRGLEGPEVAEWRVDRARQLQAIACHESQDPGNPLLARRLALQGATEHVAVRSAPFDARMARVVGRLEGRVGPGADPEAIGEVLDVLVGFAAGSTWPPGCFEPGQRCTGPIELHHAPQGWSLVAVDLGASDAFEVRAGKGWLALAPASEPIRLAIGTDVGGRGSTGSPGSRFLASRGSALVLSPGQSLELSPAGGSPGKVVLLDSTGDRAAPR